jgi:hypothetical protein
MRTETNRHFDEMHGFAAVHRRDIGCGADMCKF